MHALDAALAAAPGEDMAAIRRQLAAGVDALAAATDWVVAQWREDVPRTIAGAVPYLRLAGTVAGGWLMAKAALAADGGADPAFDAAKRRTARFYAEQILPGAASLLPAVMGGDTVLAFDLEQF
jgi:acyl-CoA dehydrogenase